MLGAHGIDTPRGAPGHAATTSSALARARTLGLAFPVIVKPNYEGSSKGIGDDAVARDAQALARACCRARCAPYPAGVLVEEFIAGIDVTVPLHRGRRRRRACSRRSSYVDRRRRRASRFNIYDYRLKNAEPSKVAVPLPGRTCRATCAARLRAISQDGGARARHARRRRASTSASARTAASTSSRSTRCPRWSRAPASSPPPRARGSTYDATHRRRSSERGALRWGCAASSRRAPRRASAEPLRVGFTFNVKRVDSKGGNDAEAEYDPPETIDAIRDALESYGHDVVPLEATPSCRAQLDARRRRRPGLQHRRGPRGPQPRGAGAGAVRAARHPVHRLRLGDAGDRARQGARQADAAAARHPHARVPGDGDRPRAAVARR